MKTIKTAELTGPKLDWAVAECEKVRTYVRPCEHTMTGLCILDADLVDMETDDAQELRYSRDWAQGGPILDRERITIRQWTSMPSIHAYMPHDGAPWGAGPTPLIAAMRCFCSKLGDVVDIPEELCQQQNS